MDVLPLCGWQGLRTRTLHPSRFLGWKDVRWTFPCEEGVVRVVCIGRPPQCRHLVGGGQ